MMTMIETMNMRVRMEAPGRAVDESTETPEEFEFDDKEA
jgi:hypothetical protein